MSPWDPRPRIGDLLIEEYYTSIVIGEWRAFGFWLDLSGKWVWFTGRAGGSEMRRIVR